MLREFNSAQRTFFRMSDCPGISNEALLCTDRSAAKEFCGSPGKDLAGCSKIALCSGVVSKEGVTEFVARFGSDESEALNFFALFGIEMATR